MDVMPPQIPADRLRAMLSGAKQIMNKVETGDYSVGNVDSRALTEDGVKQMQAEGIVRPQQNYQAPVNSAIQAQRASKLPPAILEAMQNNPIQQPTWNPTHSFDLSDVPDLIEKPIVNPQYRQPAQRPQQNQQLAEQQYQPQYQQPQYQQPIQEGMMLVNEAQLRQMMKDYMLEFMSNTFTKNLSEEVIKKTIGTLIKEGKITVKQQQPIKK